MRLDEFRELCLAQPGASESLPFGPDALVFKVRGKMFALLNLERLPETGALKCHPERAAELRERYAGVAPGWHLNKRHWNDVVLASDVPAPLIRELVGHSYALVVARLTRKERAALDAEAGANASDADA